MKKAGWLAALLLIGVPLMIHGQDAPNKEAPLTPSQSMDKLFDFWNRLDQPGFAVIVIKDGQVLYQKTFGLACQEHAVPLTPNSVFNIADAAMPFVGQAVALLEKQGKLSLDDDVRKRIPELPDFGTPVLLRHLLYHGSGLRDWPAVLQLTGKDKEEFDFAKLLKLVQTQKKLIFAPGTQSQYANVNYDLLAETIKRAAGKPFSDWIFENVFKPLKMTRTQYRENYRQILDGQALTYNFTRQEYLKGIDLLSLTGSHSMFTSIADLAKWFIHAETASANDKDFLNNLFAPGQLNDGKSAGFAYGWNVQMDSGRRRIMKSGTWAGSGAYLTYYPDQRFGFAVLANWDYTPVEGFVQSIIDIYLPAPAPAAAPQAKPVQPAAAKSGKTVKVSPQKLDMYVGDYRLGPGQMISIGHAGGQLSLQFPGQKFDLTTLSETEFLFDLVSARIIFRVGKDGKANQFAWIQGGEEMIVPRVVLVKPTPEELKEFAGSFFNDELNVRFRIDVRGDALVIIGPDAVEARMAPDEKNHFTTRAATLPTIVFQRDALNKITGFSINSAALRDLVFKKD
jgi:CubicO group peptidase (beta-lactamase class C family)